jgi:DNA (cytosine-5)-methyltransferase 1
LSTTESFFVKSRRAQSTEDYETWVESEITPTLNVFDNGGDTRATVMIIFHPHRSDGARIQGETVNTLTAFMGTGGLNTPMVLLNDNEIVGTLQARDYKGVGNQYVSENKLIVDGVTPIHDAATRSTDKRKNAYGTYTYDGKDNGLGVGEDGDPMNTLTGGDRHALSYASTVRRLTPLETERLQGFPDNWTAIDKEGKNQADSSRYKQTGNAVAVPVVEWILGRLVSEHMG